MMACRYFMEESEVEQAAALARLIADIQVAARHTIYEGISKVHPIPSFEQFRDHYAGILLSEAMAILSMKEWDETGKKPDPSSAREALVRLAERMSKVATNIDQAGDYVVAVLRKDKRQPRTGT
jgi:hypothetical protein